MVLSKNKTMGVLIVLKEQKLCILQITAGIFLFILLLIANSITEEWMNCLNPELANNIIVFLNFYHKHRIFIASILNPVSITIFLTGLIALQNLRIKRKHSIKEQFELLLWCKYHLIMIYTPEELFENIKIQNLDKRRLVGAQLQKIKLEKLINAINTACLPANWSAIETDIDCVKITVKIMKKLREIESWEEIRLTDCELMINGNIATARLDMICSKPWISDINEIIMDYIDTYYQGSEKDDEIDYFKKQWIERENKVNESNVNEIIGLKIH